MFASTAQALERMGLPVRSNALTYASVRRLLRVEYLASGLTLNCLGLALPLVVLQVFDRIIPHAALSTLQTLIAGLLVCVLVELGLRILRDSFVAWEAARLDLQTSTFMVERMLAAPTGEIDKHPLGRHVERINGVDSAREFLGSQAALLLTDAPFLFAYLGLTAALGGVLALAPVVLALVYLWPAYRTGLALASEGANRKDLEDRRFSFLLEMLGKLHSVKGLAIEEPVCRRHERLLSGAADSSLRTRYLIGVTDNLAANFSQASMVLVGLVGALMVMTGHISVGVLAACTLMTGRIAAPLLRILTSWIRLQGLQVNFARARELEELPSEPARAKPAAPFETVELRNVAVHRDEGALFRQVDLAIKRGEVVGLSGPNGSGKSTLLALLGAHRPPDSGQVLFNGVEVEHLCVRSARAQIAYLPQHPVLLRGSVLENLTRFDLAHEDEAMNLAERLGLQHYFAAHPDGYELLVGDGGENLPQGVVQRICIVRALVGDPRLILFDEANSALDQDGDRHLRQVLESFQDRSIMVLASFRPALLSLATRRLLLQQGRLIEVAVP